jgi:hypothetical protein
MQVVDQWTTEPTVIHDVGMANPFTAYVELMIQEGNPVEDPHWFANTKHIPGPHLYNLLVVGRNSIFIFLCMTMGYFRNSRIENVVCRQAQNHLRRNEQYMNERLKEVKWH